MTDLGLILVILGEIHNRTNDYSSDLCNLWSRMDGGVAVKYFRENQCVDEKVAKKVCQFEK